LEFDALLCIPRLAFCRASILVGLLSGCTAVSVTDHVVSTESSPSPKRILVLSQIGTELGRQYAPTFGATLQGRFAACGLQSFIIRTGEMQLDSGQHLKAAIKTFDPDTILSIRIYERDVAGISSDSVIGEKYEMALHNVALDHDVWKARISIRQPGRIAYPFEKLGSLLAATVTEQLIADRVLPYCAALAAPADPPAP
jgi:hypothetical protein